MKKIIFKLTIAIAALALITTSCRTDPFELNDPSRLDAPRPAEIEIVSSGVDSVVVLRVLSEGATDFQWRRNGVVVRPTDSIQIGGVMHASLRSGNQEFVMISDGLIQNAPLILAAGLNRYGTIGIFEEIPNAFFPWAVPAPASFTFPAPEQGQTANNACPVGFVRLIASSPQADRFEWFRDGQIIEGETGRILDVRDVATGEYFVRGVNYFGGTRQTGVPSNPAVIVWQSCEPAWLEGYWIGRGESNWPTDGAGPWDDTIRHSSFFGDYEAALFFTANAFGMGPVAGRLAFRDGGIFRSGEVIRTFADGRTWVQVRVWLGPGGGLTALQADIDGPPTNVLLVTATREGETEPFAFRLPATIQFAGGLGTRGGLGILEITAAGAVSGWVDAFFDVIYTRDERDDDDATTTAGTARMLPQNIQWVDNNVVPTGVGVQNIEAREFPRVRR